MDTTFRCRSIFFITNIRRRLGKNFISVDAVELRALSAVFPFVGARVVLFLERSTAVLTSERSFIRMGSFVLTKIVYHLKRLAA